MLAGSLVDEIVTLKASVLKTSDGMFHVYVPRFNTVVGKLRPDLSSQSSQADQKNETPIASSGPPDHLINADVPALMVPSTVAIVIEEMGVSGAEHTSSHVPPVHADPEVNVPSNAQFFPPRGGFGHQVQRSSVKHTSQEEAAHGSFTRHTTPSPSKPSRHVHSRFDASSLAVLQAASTEQPLLYPARMGSLQALGTDGGGGGDGMAFVVVATVVLPMVVLLVVATVVLLVVLGGGGGGLRLAQYPTLKQPDLSLVLDTK